MIEKVTEMRLKVDLHCPSCFKDVKKILCKLPQIRDQVYDEKNNTVKIIVVCCSPEKIRDKLCCKGRNLIKSIEIVEPAKWAADQGEEIPKEKSNGKPEEKPKDTDGATGPIVTAKEHPKEKPKDDNAAATGEAAPAVPNGVCCPECYEGYAGGPCYEGYRRPASPPPCYSEYSYYYYYGYYYGYDNGYYSGRCYAIRCCDYLSEENPSTCSII